MGLLSLLRCGGERPPQLYGELADVDKRVLVGSRHVESEQLDDALGHEELAVQHVGVSELDVPDIGQVHALVAALDEGVRHVEREPAHHHEGLHPVLLHRPEDAERHLEELPRHLGERPDVRDDAFGVSEKHVHHDRVGEGVGKRHHALDVGLDDGRHLLPPRAGLRVDLAPLPGLELQILGQEGVHASDAQAHQALKHLPRQDAELEPHAVILPDVPLLPLLLFGGIVDVVDVARALKRPNHVPERTE
mmetsp:Transcript_25558/g.59293  ORF Transcript_25558/g.59293 Transcript_25558/m.59293 type:complete len:249 (-) Transcript_25558:92-838(-)